MSERTVIITVHADGTYTLTCSDPETLLPRRPLREVLVALVRLDRAYRRH